MGEYSLKLMNVAEQWRVRGESKFSERENRRIGAVKRCSHIKRWGVEALLSNSKRASSKVFQRVRVGLLTKVCKRPQPRAAVFSIIARCNSLSGYIGFLLPVRARQGRLKLGVSKLRCAKSVHEKHLLEVVVEHAIPVFVRLFQNKTIIMGSKTRQILPKLTTLMVFHTRIGTKCVQFGWLARLNRLSPSIFHVHGTIRQHR